MSTGKVQQVAGKPIGTSCGQQLSECMKHIAREREKEGGKVSMRELLPNNKN